MLTHDVATPLRQTRRRLPGALGVSALTHIALFLVALIAFGHPLTRSALAPLATHLRMPPDLVWLAAAGTGENHGGGGSGDHSLQPPRRAELPGQDRVTVPVARVIEAVLPTLRPEDQPRPAMGVDIPALTLAAGLTEIPGSVQGIGTDPNAHGRGTGGRYGDGDGLGDGDGRGRGLGPGDDRGTGGDVYRVGDGVTTPIRIHQVKPLYTAEAMRLRLQGLVTLECVVLPDGAVANCRVTRSLDASHGLDQEAIKAARQWKFVPGMRSGLPVAVLIAIEMTFALQ